MSHPDSTDAVSPDPEEQPPLPDRTLREDEERMARLRHDLAVANDAGEDPLRPTHDD